MKNFDDEKYAVANRIQTPDGTILWTRYSHDYVEYTDKNGETYMIDGGPGICFRASVNKEHPATMLCVYNDEPWEVQRDVRLWGSCGLWIPVSKLSNEHIENIINDGYRNEGVRLEYEYRKKNGIVIPEHDYADEAVQAITHPKE